MVIAASRPASMGYRGKHFKEWIEQEYKWELDIVKRPSKCGRYAIDQEGQAREPVRRFSLIQSGPSLCEKGADERGISVKGIKGECS